MAIVRKDYQGCDTTSGKNLRLLTRGEKCARQMGGMRAAWRSAIALLLPHNITACFAFLLE
jgi:hypothetical protein